MMRDYDPEPFPQRVVCFLYRILVTYTNRGGEKSLRKVEMRLLNAGVTMARTADDLNRYHDKFRTYGSAAPKGERPRCRRPNRALRKLAREP